MAIEIVPVILLPTLDPSRFERCSFALQERRATMTVYMQDLEPFVILFRDICWHRFTPHDDCTSTITEGCHMAVSEVRASPALRHHVAREQVPDKLARRLHHYRIYFGKGGCHEAFARAASLRWRDAIKGWGRVRSLLTPIARAGER